MKFEKIKKRRKSIFFLLLLLATSTIIFGQDKANTNLVSFYAIKADSSISKEKILRFESSKILDKITNQMFIFYDYCDTLLSCDRSYEKEENGLVSYYHYERTGLRQNENSYYLHPPRSNNFKILELNAFPYYKNDVDAWKYSVTFGEEYSNILWKQWDGNKTSASEYRVLQKTISYNFNGNNIDCIQILATTKIEGLGETHSTFYYNKKYGFVYMLFNTIDQKEIEFKMIKSNQ